MKSFALLALGAGLALAQQISDLPECGRTCVNNMVEIAQEDFGCEEGDIECYCRNVDFGYGVRDCSQEACSSNDNTEQVISYGYNYCQGAVGSAMSSGAIPVLTSALAPAPSGSPQESGTSDSDDDEDDITSVPLVATQTNSAGETVVRTTGFTTGVLSGATESAGSAIASATSSAGSAIDSVTNSLGSELNSATQSIGSAISSLTESLASDATSTPTGGDEEEDPQETTGAEDGAGETGGEGGAQETGGEGGDGEGAAPHMTAAPLAGAIGVAAMLLF